METNLEKAKRLVIAHAAIKGIELKKDNYFFKMLELAATPDAINDLSLGNVINCPDCGSRDIFSFKLTHYKCRKCNTRHTD